MIMWYQSISINKRGNKRFNKKNNGDDNSGYNNSGFFNTNEPNIRLFNKETNLKLKDIDIPFIDLRTNEWISEDRMTDAQKIDNPKFHITGGFLIKRTYKEAWRLYWDTKASKEDKQKFLNLPNFDADIFEEITGINVRKNDSCNGKIIEIEGKKYKLEELE